MRFNSTPPPPTHRVLVAERSATVGMAIATWLRGWGMAAAAVRSASQANAALAADRHDLVVADATLDGLEAGDVPVLTLLPADAPPTPGPCLARPVQQDALRAAVADCLTPHAAPRIDAEAIAALWGGTDSAAFRRVAQVFLAEAPARIEAIAVACAPPDRPRLEREAHSLAGASPNVGAADLARLARAIEHAAVDASAAALAAMVAALRRAGARDLPALRRLAGD